MVDFLTFTPPLKNSFKTARKDFSVRECILIRLEKEGITAWGEISPLPGFSAAAFDEVKQQVQESKSFITGFFESEFTMPEVNQLTSSFQEFPSIQCGLFTMAVSYLAQQKKQSMHHFLFKQPAEKIKMNFVLDLKEKNSIQKIDRQVERGFETVKVKAGSKREKSVKQIKEIRTAFKNLKIRLDANQNWSLDVAVDFLSQTEKYEIEYCEEPLAKPSAQNLLKLKESVSIPLALDETMACWPNTEDQALIADVLILKPMVIGSVAKVDAICNFAQKNNKEIVFTSSLGTAVERLITASLAAGFGSKKHAHGLKTGHILKNDLWDDAKLFSYGQYKLPGYHQLKQLMAAGTSGIKLKSI